MQRAEIYLSDQPKKKREAVTPSPTPTPKTKKGAQRIKALSPKIQKDEQLEVELVFFADNNLTLYKTTKFETSPI